MHTLLKYILWSLAAYAAYCGLLFLLQRHIIFPRYQIPRPSQTRPNIAGLETIWLNAGFGKVEAWFLPPLADPNSGPAPAVIFGHGNGEIIDYWPEELNFLTRLGIGVLLVEYPGYGRSEGSPSQDRITKTFIAAYDLLAARKSVDASRLFLIGRSLGGGAVCALAAERPSAVIILMSTFTSARSFAKRFLAPGFLVRDPFDNRSVIENYRGPVLIVHGRHDTVIPYSHGIALRDAAKRATMITYNAGHNDCPPDWSVFRRDVEAFLRTSSII